MAKKIVLKTKEHSGDVDAFLGRITPIERREDAKKLLALMKRVTKQKPKMWGTSIVGFGKYTYKRKNGDVGEYLATGFSPRKNALTVYIMPGYSNYDALLKKLGPYTKGASCLYIKRLSDIELTVLMELVRRGLQDLSKTHEVR